ncbi:MAG TPA: PaaI family thioesterase [Casimicrobiaceae bacterium]
MPSSPSAAPSARSAYVPLNPDYEKRVRESFARQGAMRLFGARLVEIRPGFCSIELPYRTDLTQQHGYVHAGVVAAIVDSAGGYAGFTLFPEDASVLTVEYKLNLLAPAAGERLVAQGEVVKPGRTLTITRGEVFAEAQGKRTLCAIMQQTLIVLSGKPDA